MIEDQDGKNYEADLAETSREFEVLNSAIAAGQEHNGAYREQLAVANEYLATQGEVGQKVALKWAEKIKFALGFRN